MTTTINCWYKKSLKADFINLPNELQIELLFRNGTQVQISSNSQLPSFQRTVKESSEFGKYVMSIVISVYMMLMVSVQGLATEVFSGRLT